MLGQYSFFGEGWVFCFPKKKEMWLLNDLKLLLVFACRLLHQAVKCIIE